jgi:cytochrome c oxidase assembly factor CtaG
MTLLGIDATSLPLATSTNLEAVFQIGPLVIAGLLYARRVRTLAFEGRNPVPGWRQACFYSGFVVIAAALTSLGPISQQLLFMHMVEHLLLGDVAALLIVLGLTGPLIAPILRISVFDRLRVLANPLIAFPLWAINLYMWHLPTMYEAALHHGGVHALEHAMFLGFGINMWMCLFGPLPMPSWFGNLGKLIYIIAVRLAGTVLGNIFLWSGTVFYPYYIRGDIKYHISPIADQNIAGAVMMVEESLLTIGLFCWLFICAARESEERQELLDYAQAHGIELTDKRAARAVSAGRAAELRERLEDLAGTGASETAARRRDTELELTPQGQRTDHSASERQLS